jgi:hypothetical protein
MLDIAGRRICAFPEAVDDITQSKLSLTTAGDPTAKAKTVAANGIQMQVVDALSC